MGGIVADIITPVSQVFGMISQIFAKIMDFMNKALFFQIIAFIIIMGKCIFAAFNFVIKVLIWFFKDFILWMFIGKDSSTWNDLFNPKRTDGRRKACFLCWIIRYIMVVVYKVTTFPKCFLWYFLDTAGWIIYLPFRFIFWLIDWLLSVGLVDAEHKAWDFLDQIDYFVHGKPHDNYFMYQYSPSDDNIDSDGKELVDGKDPNTMSLGLHIIHFPDSVMFQCYSISPFSMADFPAFPMKEFIDFIKCLTHPF